MVPLCEGSIVAPPCFHSNLGQLDKFQKLKYCSDYNTGAEFGIPDLVFRYISSTSALKILVDEARAFKEHDRTRNISGCDFHSQSSCFPSHRW